jgi:hypothetical protein
LIAWFLIALLLVALHAAQASLTSIRAEYEASQASLFELTAAQEAAASSASTAEQLATEVRPET